MLDNTSLNTLHGPIKSSAFPPRREHVIPPDPSGHDTDIHGWDPLSSWTATSMKKNQKLLLGVPQLTARFLPNILVWFGHQLTQVVMHQTARIKCFCNLIQSAPIPSSSTTSLETSPTLSALFQGSSGAFKCRCFPSRENGFGRKNK